MSPGMARELTFRKDALPTRDVYPSVHKEMWRLRHLEQGLRLVTPTRAFPCSHNHGIPHVVYGERP
jgi:hypothetical protein